jgi:hypothetical protein
MRSLPVVLALALLPACASHVLIPSDERARLERDLSGKDRERFLRLSYYVTPFFGDSTKRLLTAVPPDEVRLLDTPSGESVNPGPVEKVLPAGTHARIVSLEFPTSFNMAGRVLYTPRTQPWVYLEVEGMPAQPPLIVVLRPMLATGDEVVAELERYLSVRDPAEQLASFSESVRAAVSSKSAVPEMPAAALEMAWGFPERKQISYEGQVRKEEWKWPGGRRAAWLADGRVVKLEGAGKALP